MTVPTHRNGSPSSWVCSTTAFRLPPHRPGIPQSALAEGPRIRLALSRAVSGLYKMLIGQDVFTFTCLFRAYRREVLETIRFRSNGFAAVAEIMLRGMLAGHRVRELPMRLEQRRFGESKLKIGDVVVAHAALLTLTAALVRCAALRRAAWLCYKSDAHGDTRDMRC